ncbi:hypothetical protein BDW62DRAFT_201517 [Aspergillus aurantiobrunneus]
MLELLRAHPSELIEKMAKNTIVMCDDHSNAFKRPGLTADLQWYSGELLQPA